MRTVSNLNDELSKARKQPLKAYTYFYPLAPTVADKFGTALATTELKSHCVAAPNATFEESKSSRRNPRDVDPAYGAPAELGESCEKEIRPM